MNEQIKALDNVAQEYAGRIAGNDEDSNYAAWFNIYKEKFADLIIAGCMAQPRVYLLNKLDATDSDAQWQLHGWTSDLKVAQAWRDSSGRDERHDMQDLFFVKHIT
jgi:hypothetical protein